MFAPHETPVPTKLHAQCLAAARAAVAAIREPTTAMATAAHRIVTDTDRGGEVRINLATSVWQAMIDEMLK